jgi:hypothetical protein
MNRFEAAPEAAMLPVEEVVSLHNLIMGDVRQQRSQVSGKGIRRKDDPRGYAFCMLNNPEDMPSEDTGSLTTYLGVLLTKRHTRHWSMLVSFLDGYNSRSMANTNYRTLYRMDWTKTIAQGMTWSIETVAERDSNRLVIDVPDKKKWEKIYTTGGSEHFVTPISGMSPDDLDIVRERVSLVSFGNLDSDDRRFEHAMSQRETPQDDGELSYSFARELALNSSNTGGLNEDNQVQPFVSASGNASADQSHRTIRSRRF